ncbi:MAG: DUF1292 domain-containing protein [Epulopiscium sp.]|nr:DUF1292 domain-containing protein [Candidatus Epulonipiscium sp.]
MSEHDCGCNNHNHNDCGCDHNHDEEIIYLTLDDDTELKCNIIGTFELDNKDYIALLPEGEDQILLYGYKEEKDEICIINIDDDDEFDKVSDVFMDEFADEIESMDEDYDFDEDFEDDEEE